MYRMKLSLFFLATYRARAYGSEGRLYEEILEEVELPIARTSSECGSPNITFSPTGERSRRQ
jgi:hypothetical protein